MNPSQTGPRLKLGPDQPDLLKEKRPYFLIPMDEDNARKEATKRVTAWIEKAHCTERAHPISPTITDVYVISHGWHRNFFGAVAAYDRLMGRFVALRRRGRIKTDKSWHPLFLTLYWHSDPGTDDFYDAQGRRNKQDFLSRIKALFEPITDVALIQQCQGDHPDIDLRRAADHACFTNDFEDIFAYLTKLSTTDATPYETPEDPKEPDRLSKILCRYQLLDRTSSSQDTDFNKATVVWQCYHESIPRGVLLNQSESEKPIDFLPPGRRISGIGRFLAGVGVIGTLALGFVKWLGPVLWKILAPALASLSLPGNENDLLVPVRVGALWGFLAIYALIHFVVLGAIDRRRGIKDGDHIHGLPYLSILLWFFLQIPALALALVYVFTSYIITTITGHVRLFDERYGKRDEPIAPHKETPISLGERFADIARWPMNQLKHALGADNKLLVPIGLLENQLAFFEMQREAVKTGERAAEVLHELLDSQSNWAPKVHLMGHSFGGLVVANAARHLALNYGKKVHSICLVQAAMGSAWFDKEKKVVESVRGTIGNIYSRYDTANGSIYPLANQGRAAAGFLGLYGGETFKADCHGANGELASVISPPDLSNLGKVINLDASKLIYQGSAATGGGHNDIFKDDVLNLMFAVTQKSEGGQ